VRAWHQETQLAQDDPPEARCALTRLCQQGLDRHEAMHAAASVLTHTVWEAANQRGAAADATDRYVQGLKDITRGSWLRERE
jgi:hypothetical protein